MIRSEAVAEKTRNLVMLHFLATGENPIEKRYYLR